MLLDDDEDEDVVVVVVVMWAETVGEIGTKSTSRWLSSELSFRTSRAIASSGDLEIVTDAGDATDAATDVPVDGDDEDELDDDDDEGETDEDAAAATTAAAAEDVTAELAIASLRSANFFFRGVRSIKIAAVLPDTSSDKSRLSGETMWWTRAFKKGNRLLLGANSTLMLRSTISAGDVNREDADEV